jgi:DNA repair exonuclease SbcCD ATPase subunit
MLTFQKLRAKNFLSYSNEWIEFDLNSKDLTLIVGNNGSGKSIMLEVLSYCLMGKSLRKINNKELINWTNKKALATEVEFITRAGKSCKIARGLKPEFLKIYFKNNDEFELQLEYNKNDMQAYIEKELLGFDEKIFRQLCLLGSDLHTPFMKLSLGERRQIIEQLFELDVISRMNEVIKEKKKIILEKLKEIDIKRNLLENTIKNLNDELERANAHNKKEEEKINQKISEYKDEIENLKGKEIKEKGILKEYENNLLSYQKEIENLNNDSLIARKKRINDLLCKKDSNEIKEIQNKIEKLQELIVKEQIELKTVRDKDYNCVNETNKKYEKEKYVFEQQKNLVQNEISKLGKQKEYYEIHTKCKECGQKIDENFKKEVIEKIEKEIDKNNQIYIEIEIENKILKEEIEKEIENLKEIYRLKDVKLTKNINDSEKEIKDFRSKIKELENDEIVKNKELNAEINEIEKKLSNYNELLNEKIKCEGKIKEITQNLKWMEESIKEKYGSIEDIKKYSLKVDIVEIEDKLKENRKLIVTENTSIEKFNKGLLYFEELLKLCSDNGIRAVMIEKYLPILNMKMKEFVTLFGMDWDVEFNNKFETVIKKRNEEIEYECASSGQRQRINLAILFTFMSFAKIKSGISTNLIIFDEILDSSLDEEGAEVLFNILDRIVNDGHTIYVISHRVTNFDRFEKMIKVEMKDGFTKMCYN